MAAMVSTAHSGGMDGGNMLVPPDGLVKLKDKTIPVIEQVGFVVLFRASSHDREGAWRVLSCCHLLYVHTALGGCWWGRSGHMTPVDLLEVAVAPPTVEHCRLLSISRPESLLRVVTIHDRFTSHSSWSGLFGLSTTNRRNKLGSVQDGVVRAAENPFLCALSPPFSSVPCPPGRFRCVLVDGHHNIIISYVLRSMYSIISYKNETARRTAICVHNQLYSSIGVTNLTATLPR